MALVSLQPAGFYPSGYGAPVDTDEAPDAPENARYLDYLTGDYIIGSDGEIERMPTTRQRVWLALGTLRGSSTVLPMLGVKLPGVVSRAYEIEVKQAVRTALAALISDGSIVVNEILVEHGNPIGRSKITVDYTDTATEENDKVNV
jgi:hypothetical protein